MNKNTNKENIKKYIEDNLSKGFQINKIKEKLIKSGYNLNEIDEVINILQGKRKKISSIKKVGAIVGVIIICIFSFFILADILSESKLKNDMWTGRIFYVSNKKMVTGCDIFSNFSCAQEYGKELKTFNECKRILTSEAEIEICRILLLGDESLCRNLPYDQHTPPEIWENECFQRMAILKQDLSLCSQLKEIDIEGFERFNSTFCINQVNMMEHLVFVQYR